MPFSHDYTKAIDKDFFLRNPEIVAKELLGKVLVKRDGNEFLAGMITECEAYLSSGDLSSHSACGKTKRNAPMFAEGGILYVYKIYGVHHCINFVTEFEDVGSAVLIRAVKPLLGIELMHNRRETKNEKTLCKGPGNLAKAFNFTLSDNNKSLYANGLFVQNYYEPQESEIIVSERIGILKSKELPLRFQIAH